MLGGVANGGAQEERCERLVLLLQLTQHELHLSAVLRHEVSLSLDQQRTVLADVVDLVCRELSHLCRAATRQDLLAHVLTRVDPCRAGRWCEGGRLVHVGSIVHVDAQQAAIVGEGDTRGDGAGVELHGIDLRSVGHGHRRLLDVHHTIAGGRLLTDVGHAQIALGKGGEVAWLVGGLLHQHADAQHGLGKEVDGPFRRYPWAVLAKLGLSLGRTNC